jgi:hypothetical protein
MTERNHDRSGNEKLNTPERRTGTSLSAFLINKEFLSRKRPSQSLSRRRIINHINWFNFLGTPLLVHLRDTRYGNEFLAPAYPDSCLDDTVSCRWAGGRPAGTGSFEILNLVISDGLTVVLIPVTDIFLRDASFITHLPDCGFSFGKRSSRRYPALEGIRAEISQSGFNARGSLLDFSSQTFRIEAETEAPDSFHWFQPDRNILVRLFDGEDVVYQGICRCVRQTLGVRKRELVLAGLPEESPATGKEKRKRSTRRNLRPAAFLTFRHPLSGEKIQRDIESISMTGFSVSEKKEEGVLLQGMVLPEARIGFNGNTAITFRSRVVHRREHSDRAHSGLSFLDMEIKDARVLGHILVNLGDPHLSIAHEPEMDVLWSFLFRTGFLYPKKYGMIHEHRETLKETFQKLYCLHPDIADHFLYQKDGEIYGHISIVRGYERSWVVHHLAALRMGSVRVALTLIKQNLEYIEGVHRFPSMRMDYLIVYYRPENRFPNIAAELARNLGNPKGCSQDLFAYLDIHSAGSSSTLLPTGWSLEDFSPAHRVPLEQYYEHISGGLLLEVLLEGTEEGTMPEVEAAYRRHGMKRRVRIFSLLHDGQLKAVLWQNESNLGLNLSELLNCIKVVVVDPQSLPWTVLRAAMRKLAISYATEHVPALVFPVSYLTEQHVRTQKYYMMWIMNNQFARSVIDYLTMRVRRIKRFLMLFGWLRKVLKK